jgi:arabinan endo-1,5-alpha-L-arabinosidase
MQRMTAPVLLVILLLTACGSVRSAVSETPELAVQTTLPMTGDIGDYNAEKSIDDPVHDPSLFHDARTGTYYVASTGILRTKDDPGGIFLRRSQGSLSGPWESLGEVPLPEWTKEYGVLHLWAPDVAQQEGWFYLYYSASSFGSNTSAIGVARTQTPGDLDSWEDLGPVLTSDRSKNYNAIDPYVFKDRGSWWIAFGSFWTGIKLQEMRSLTEPAGPVYALASRPGVRYNPIESPAIFKRGGYYYLMAAWDFCCSGVNSSYKTVVGRSKNLTGPYLDMDGKRLDEGGGTVILSRRDNQVGTGGGDILREGNDYYFVHHYYDANAGGVIRMQIRKLDWQGDWPYFLDPGPYNLQEDTRYRLVNETSGLCLDVAGGSATPGTNVRQWGCNDGDAQSWRLEDALGGFYRLRSGVGGGELCLELEDGAATPGTNVLVESCEEVLPVPNKHRRTAQHWHFEDMGRGFQRLISEASGLALDNAGGSTTPGSNIVGWTPNTFSPQNWRLERLP